MVGAMLPGCRRRAGDSVLLVDVLADAVPPVLLDELQRQFQPDAKFQIRQAKNLAALYDRLQSYQTPPSTHETEAAASSSRRRAADLANLGDTWLTPAIQNGLIQPLPLEGWPGWGQLPAPWQRLVRRNANGFPDPDGDIWAAPYRWGMLAIAYRKDRFEENPPTDWDILWQPDLAQRISLPDQARAVIGLTLKSLGQSVNFGDVGAIASLPETLAALNQQTLFYSSSAYLQPLILDDTWIAVGWSTDIIPQLRKNPRLGAIIPQSGTILVADAWVHPTRATPDAPSANVRDDLMQRWVSYFWQPDVAARLSLLGAATSPIVVNPDTTIPESLQSNPLALPAPDILNRSEFLVPFNEATAQQYQQLWDMMRQSPG